MATNKLLAVQLRSAKELLEQVAERLESPIGEMDTRKAEVITEFCKISETVGHHFKSQHAYDCFCPSNIKQSSSYQYDDIVLDFIRDAVSEKIKREQGEK
jgi:hypothetical protein